MLGERFRDALPLGVPYDGLAAVAYDAWLPPGVVLPDDLVHEQVIRESGGLALELGVGNGRFLIPRLKQGLIAEGLDSSADMLDRCRRHADDRGLVLDDGGRVTEALVRKHRLRWWTRSQLAELISSAGFVEVKSVGSGEGWVTVASRP